MPNIVKNTSSINPLDFIAPHTCRGCGRIGIAFCDRCKNNIITQHQNFCPFCKTPNRSGICKNCHNLPPIFIVGKRSEIIGTLIHDFKYSSTRALKTPLAQILNQILPNINGQTSIVPLPTINKHIRERGLDHTYLIAKKFAQLRAPQCQIEKLLVRATNTVQVGSNRAKRFIQAKNTYTLKKHAHINSSTTYILFDDVWTTGASMLAATKKLREAGAEKIIIATLAFSVLDE